ncbi:unnamed protein product [Allacma fusca]|uniref:Uncharacterized protein n=1 Tax=Allacma fusca TaxID=39272 RepID=A0A8J2NUX0_9HEXA|nr:unnamed protein product [Allacma fusca]
MNRQFTPDTAVEPTTVVEVSISCRDLLDKDIFSRSDPMACVYYQPVGSNEWIEFLRTEIIYNNLNPDFATKITMDYRFEEEQLLRIELYDIDSPSMNLSDHDFLGFSECTLGQIVSAGFHGLQIPLSHNRSKYYPILPKQNKMSKGCIILIAEELTQLKEELTIKFEGVSMGSSVCCLFPPKIFFELSKANESGKHVLIHRSEACEGESPTWEPVTMTMRSICNGDKDRGLRIQCFQVGMNGYHSSLGFLHTTVNKLLEMKGQSDGVPLVNSSNVEKSARLVLVHCTISPIYTFMEYIKNGTQIHCCFAIDFTASNGDPNEGNSLHHFSSQNNHTCPNPYEQAIQAVGDIIQDYDQTKQFPVYGFGARVPPAGTVSHNFYVTLNPDSPYCDDIVGVQNAYRNCVRQIQLAGPTNFAPIVKDVASLAKQSITGEHYYVLLIITDGIINDMPDTKEAIVTASSLPLSIIIVGVGQANFAAMDELDGDVVPLSFEGKLAERDIVQFVPFRDAQTWMASVCPEVAGKWSSSYDQTNRLAKVKLAQEVLAEIPDQLTSFMRSRGIIPAQPSTSAGKKK